MHFLLQLYRLSTNNEHKCFTIIQLLPQLSHLNFFWHQACSQKHVVCNRGNVAVQVKGLLPDGADDEDVHDFRARRSNHDRGDQGDRDGDGGGDTATLSPARTRRSGLMHRAQASNSKTLGGAAQQRALRWSDSPVSAQLRRWQESRQPADSR